MDIFEKQNEVYEGMENLFAEPEPSKQAAQKQAPQKQAPQKQAPPLPARRKADLGQLEQRMPVIGKGRTIPSKANTAQQEKKAENPQRVQSNFQKLSGTKPAASQRKALIGNHQKQAELKQEKGRSMG